MAFASLYAVSVGARATEGGTDLRPSSVSGHLGELTWNEGGLDELVKGCFIGPMPMWKAELHRKFGMFDETYHVAGDYEFWLRLASRGVKFRRYAEPLGAYTRREKGAELREPLRTTWETARARSKYKGR